MKLTTRTRMKLVPVSCKYPLILYYAKRLGPFSIVLYINMPSSSRGCKPRIEKNSNEECFIGFKAHARDVFSIFWWLVRFIIYKWVLKKALLFWPQQRNLLLLRALDRAHLITCLKIFFSHTYCPVFIKSLQRKFDKSRSVKSRRLAKRPESFHFSTVFI